MYTKALRRLRADALVYGVTDHNNRINTTQLRLAHIYPQISVQNESPKMCFNHTVSLEILCDPALPT